jgi:hypothetical protein
MSTDTGRYGVSSWRSYGFLSHGLEQVGPILEKPNDINDDGPQMLEEAASGTERNDRGSPGDNPWRRRNANWLSGWG